MMQSVKDKQALSIRIRRLDQSDLERANTIIESAVMSWGLPDRIKRLSLPIYRYNLEDFRHLTLVGAESPHGSLVGIAAWEAADLRENPRGHTALLLHGLYVQPDWHGRGIGTQLLAAATEAAECEGYDGLLVKAVRESQSFFASRGLQPLQLEDPMHDYPSGTYS